MARVRVVSICHVLFLSLFLGVYQTLCDEPIVLLCAIDGYDYFNLTAVTWFFNVDQQHCFTMNKTQPATRCTLDMAICHSFDSPGLCENSSVCSVSDQGQLSLGAYRQNPFGPLESPQNVGGFDADFPNGSRYSTASDTVCVLQTNIIFLCNASAIWTTGVSETRQKAPDPKFMSYNNTSCQLNLGFDYAGACKKEPLSEQGMSAGTVLILIFFVSLILYFVFGAMINLARGRVGADVIPHAKFWSMLPVYIIDGFQFAFCCGRLPVTATYEQI